MEFAAAVCAKHTLDFITNMSFMAILFPTGQGWIYYLLDQISLHGVRPPQASQERPKMAPYPRWHEMTSKWIEITQSR